VVQRSGGMVETIACSLGKGVSAETVRQPEKRTEGEQGVATDRKNARGQPKRLRKKKKKFSSKKRGGRNRLPGESRLSKPAKHPVAHVDWAVGTNLSTKERRKAQGKKQSSGGTRKLKDWPL